MQTQMAVDLPQSLERIFTLFVLLCLSKNPIYAFILNVFCDISCFLMLLISFLLLNNFDIYFNFFYFNDTTTRHYGKPQFKKKKRSHELGIIERIIHIEENIFSFS